MGILSALFGGNSSEIKQHLANGAAIVDVRTPGEFQGGHVAGSINIPLNTVEAKVNDFKKLKSPIVLCCASGNRSGQAARFLKSQGIECVNGGSWTSVNAQV